MILGRSLRREGCEYALHLENEQNVAIFMDPASEDMARPLRSSVKLDVVDPDGVLKRLKIEL